MTPPVLVLVTGPPSSGKTTLAHALARTLGYPAVSWDELKQACVPEAVAEFVRAPAGAAEWNT